MLSCMSTASSSSLISSKISTFMRSFPTSRRSTSMNLISVILLITTDSLPVLLLNLLIKCLIGVDVATCFCVTAFCIVIVVVVAVVITSVEGRVMFLRVCLSVCLSVSLLVY